MPRRQQRSSSDEAAALRTPQHSRFNQFIKAVGSSNLKKVAAILDDGFEIDTSSLRTDGFTGLHFASQEGDERMVSLLLSRGASIDLRTGTTSMTALMLASNFGKSKVVKRLLAAGAQLDLREPSVGGTALMMAANAGHTDVVIELLSAGASANRAGESSWEGKSAMILALEGGHAETADALAPHTSFEQAQIDHVLAFIQKYGPASEAPAEAEVEARAEPTQGQQHVEVEEVSNCGDRNASSIPGQLELAAQLVRIAM